MTRKPTIALTGATGFLGSHLMASLLSSGHRIIILGRSNKKETLAERISRLLKWFNIDDTTGQLQLVEIDLLKPLLGLPEEEYNKLCAVTDQVIHCASDTSFTERKRDIVFRSNVECLEGILKFAERAKVSFFHYISTAYVSGANSALCKESISGATDFFNVYEESKAAAEKVIEMFCRKNSIPFTLIRPSIIYGDSLTGRSLRFNALYFPLKSLKFIKEIYLNDIRNNGGRKSAQSGIFIDKDGNLFLPLRIYLPREGSVNIVPVDYFVNATMKIMANACSGRIYHVTNSSHIKLETISKYNERLMKIRGVEIVYGKSADNVLRNPAEEMFDRFIEPYRPYLSDCRLFERVNTDEATGNIRAPEFTYEVFRRCMEYAISINWGESIF